MEMGTLDARSPEGHAAHSIQGTDERWVLIQVNTFKNWINDQLRQSAVDNLSVEDLRKDLCDGIKLCYLMEVVQGRRIGRIIKKPMNQHHYLENCNIALRAMTNDGIKLVNIGSEDIVNSNMRLILGLLWRLILKYQISRSKVPPKKLMLSWLHAICPDLQIQNFNSDWNDGVALHALIEYCKPGTCPNWRQLSRRDGLANCRDGMQLAKEHFNIPMVVSPENLASPDLDELSGMTYLSYFMKVDSPGYNATLRFVKGQVPSKNVQNFQTDWNDGLVLGSLVHSLGGHIPGWPDNVDFSDHEGLIQKGMNSAKTIGVEPVISAHEMADTEVDHLGVMAYAAWFEHLRPKAPIAPPSPHPPAPMPVIRTPTPPPVYTTPPSEKISLVAGQTETATGQTVNFKLEALQGDIKKGEVRVEVIGPSSKPLVTLNWQGMTGYGEFTPVEQGPHKIVVYNEGEVVRGAPADIQVTSAIASVSLIQPIRDTAAGSTSQILISAHDARRGAVRVEAKSPSGRMQEMAIGENNGVYTANFTPTEVGDWLISILYEGTHIQGSPFNVRVYDAAQVKVFGLEGGAVGKMFSFSVDTAGAGEGALKVQISHDGREVPVQVYHEGRGMYRVNFTPDGGGLYTIRVYFAEMEVTGSPYSLEIVDSSMVTAVGEGLSSVEVNRKASFTVNTGHKGSSGDIKVTIRSPRGQQIPSEIINNGDGTHTIEYQANDVGEYQIDVYYYGKPITGSPFRVQAFDWNRISLQNLSQTGTVGKLVEFDIDAQHAGSGNLEIMVNDGTIPCSVQNRGNRQFHATFMPKEAVQHFIQMRFNGREVPGSPWRVDMRSAAHVTVKGTGMQLVPINTPATFEVQTGQYDGHVTANITSPTRRVVSGQVINNNNGSYNVQYTPTEVGNHLIEIAYNGMAVPGSPFSSKAYDTSAIVVSQISSGVTGKSTEFTIDVTQAGEGQLEIMVNRGAVPNTVKMLRKGVFLVNFTPREPRNHMVDIKFNGEILRSCPITVPVLDASRVTVQGDGIRQVAVNRSSFFRVNTQSAGDADLSVRVTSPTGSNVPARVAGAPAQGFDVDFKPQEVGAYRVDIEYADQPVPGSPFTMKSYDAGRVLVEGLRDGVVAKRGEFNVDVIDAGEGNLEISISAGGKNIQNHVKQLSQGKFEVSYTPMEGGLHQANITFNGDHVPGSPFPFNVTDATNVTATGDGLGLVPCGKPTSFTIQAPGGLIQDIAVRIVGADGRDIHPRIHDTGGGNFLVDWTPRIPGDHKVEVKYRNQQIQGSTFTAKAWDASAVIVSNIRAGRMGKPNYFNVDASRAGAGNLELIVSVAGENVPNFVKAEGNARFEVSYTPHTPEAHMISVKFNGEVVPGSPFVCENADSGLPLPVDSGMVRVPVGRPAVISIDPRKGGQLAQQADVQVVAPSDRIIQTKVKTTSRNRLTAEFIPTEVGPHCIQATIGTFEIPGSPFGCEVYDINQVRVNKLNRGLVGKPYEFDIDTSRAGAGEISMMAKCDNRKVPTKVVNKGAGLYKGYFMPKEPRRHIVFISYTKEAIPGSPFMIDVEDGTLVAAVGRCLEATPIHEPAKFSIDPSKAPFKADAHISIVGPSPMKRSIRYQSRGNYLEGWHVEWTPKELGVHTIDVKYGDSYVQGSPFRCKVFDLSKVMLVRDKSMEGVDLDGIPGEDIVFFVDASEAGAGNLEIIVRCAATGQRIPNFLEAEDRGGKFRIFFTPKENCYRYRVDVTFNEQQVEGSPFYATIVDGTKASASGDGLRKVPANKAGHFDVITQGVGEANLETTVTAPSGRKVPARITGSPGTGYHVEYTPSEIGRHTVRILYADVDVQGSPYMVDVYDANNVRVGNIPDGVLGKPVVFEVDASNAGDGTLTVDVQAATSKPYPEVLPKGGGKYQVSFVPHEINQHAITVLFNHERVPGSPFTCNMYDTNSVHVNWESVRLVPVRKPVTFFLDPRGIPEQAISVDVKDPYNRSVHARTVRHQQQHQIEFTPNEVGPHIVSVLYGAQPVPGSPATTFAYDSSRVRLTDVTHDGGVGQELGFTVDTSEAGQGDIDVEVSCNGQAVPTTRQQLDTFRQRYTFVPMVSMDHTIDVAFNYEKVQGSPLIMRVADPINSLSILTSAGNLGLVDQLTQTTISTRGNPIDLSQLAVTVSAPNGDLVPAKIVQQPDGDYKVEYSSTYTGRHTVEILYSGQPIMGSPFYVEIYDPNKIRVEGSRSGNVGQLMDFEIIRIEAGKAELGVNVTSPSGVSTQYNIVPTKLGDRVTYTPMEPGAYLIYITYGGLEVPDYSSGVVTYEHQVFPGCPITQTIMDTSFANAYGDGLHKGLEDIPSSFMVDTKGQRGDLAVEVEGPNSMAKCYKQPNGQGQYTVTFTPVEVGDFTVHVKWNGRDIEGSPFQPKVVDPRKLRVIGGWDALVDNKNHFLNLTVAETKRLEFDCSLAGPGVLTAEARGPDGLVATQVERLGSSQILTFTPRAPGDHNLSLFWSDNPVPRSPLMGNAKGGNVNVGLVGQAAPVNHEKVVLTGRGLKEAIVRQEAEFVIDGMEAGPGAPEVTLTGVKTDIHVQVTPLGEQKYRCVYLPNLPGAYLLNIMWSDRQVRGSPFKVNVIAHSDASKVVCTGEGLKTGILGKEIKSLIDTRQAGPGELTAHCMGPSKVAFCELYDHRNGTFELNVRPQEPGRHVLQVKYGGEHVPGSPYVLKVSGAPDASKVRVSGPGVEHGILATYQSRFICETRGAGAGQLTVRIRGPKGAFRVEMQRESQKDRTILCRYDPTEVGDYVISVKWSGVDVPGSPFHIQIFDTKEELDRFMADNPARRQNAPVFPPRSDGGWAEDI